MSTGKKLQVVHAEGCIPAPLRRALDQISRNSLILLPLTSGEPSPDLQINVTNLTTNEGDDLALSFVSAIFRRGTIGSALVRDGTATLTPVSGGGTAVTVHGYFVKADWQIPSGSRVGALNVGGVWIAIVTDTCLEEVP